MGAGWGLLQLLFSAGNMSLVKYEGCERIFIGAIVDTTLVKLRFDKPVASYLAYPTFDADLHPPLAGSVIVPLQTFRVSPLAF
jgi:hypothetical protein